MSKNSIIAIIIAVVVLGGGAGAYMLTKKEHGNDKTADSSKVAEKTNAKKYGDACGVLTKEAIAATLGGTYGEGEEGIGTSTGTPGTDNYDDLKGSECTFKQDNDGTTAGMTAALDLSVAINNYSDTADAATFMGDLHNPQTVEGQAAMGEPTDVEGVGDMAFFPRVNTANGLYEKTEALYIQDGRQVVVLTATSLKGVDRDAVRAGLTKLAKEL